MAAGLPIGARAAHAAGPTTAECLSASNASIDMRIAHKLRDARGELLVCASASCPAEVRAECLSKFAEVDAEIPTIVFEAKDGTGLDRSAVRVVMDGHPLAERLDGTALAVDPGEHTFTFETADLPSIAKTFVIREAEKDRHEPIILGLPPAGAPATATSPRGPLATMGATASGIVEPARAPLTGQKLAALVASGMGLVGVATGGAFGLIALSRRNEAQSVCPDRCSTKAGVQDWSAAKSASNLSTASVVVGGIGLIGAAVLWFTAPSSGRGAHVRVGLGIGDLRVVGAWR